jgi:hypothetical protein
MARILERRGDLAVDPVAAVERLRGDLDAILRHAQPSDVLFGPEGANRGPLIFGAIGQGETEYDDPDGAVARVPFDAARDLRETAVHAFFAATKSFRDGARAIFRFFKGLTVHGGKK